MYLQQTNCEYGADTHLALYRHFQTENSIDGENKDQNIDDKVEGACRNYVCIVINASSPEQERIPDLLSWNTLGYLYYDSSDVIESIQDH